MTNLYEDDYPDGIADDPRDIEVPGMTGMEIGIIIFGCSMTAALAFYGLANLIVAVWEMVVP